MARGGPRRPEYVVQLRLEAIAVLTVEADSRDEACAIAEERVRPVDVTELGETLDCLVVPVSEAVEAAAGELVERAREKAAKGRGRGRQA